ncbi:hypothetical protein BG004_007129 [Podila humilis]|nr:hypothetical protein BG004_007129 [Podila humilis]
MEPAAKKTIQPRAGLRRPDYGPMQHRVEQKRPGTPHVKKRRMVVDDQLLKVLHQTHIGSSSLYNSSSSNSSIINIGSGTGFEGRDVDVELLTSSHRTHESNNAVRNSQSWFDPPAAQDHPGVESNELQRIDTSYTQSVIMTPKRESRSRDVIGSGRRTPRRRRSRSNNPPTRTTPMKALADADQARINRMISNAYRPETTGRERHSPMTILRTLSRSKALFILDNDNGTSCVEGFNPPPQPSPDRPPIPGSSQWKKLTPKSTRTRHIPMDGTDLAKNPFLVSNPASPENRGLIASRSMYNGIMGQRRNLSDVAAATAQNLAFLRYKDENPFLDPKDYYQLWEDEQDEPAVARANEHTFRLSFGMQGLDDANALDMDGDTGTFSHVGQHDLSNPFLESADHADRPTHIDEITILSEADLERMETQKHQSQDRRREQDRDHYEDEQDEEKVQFEGDGQNEEYDQRVEDWQSERRGDNQEQQLPPDDELEELEAMDRDRSPGSQMTDVHPASVGTILSDDMGEEEQLQDSLGGEQGSEVEELGDHGIQYVEPPPDKQMEHVTREEDGAEEEPEQEQDEVHHGQPALPQDEGQVPFDKDLEAEALAAQMEEDQDAFDEDLEAEAFAAQMEEDEATEKAEQEAAKLAELAAMADDDLAEQENLHDAEQLDPEVLDENMQSVSPQPQRSPAVDEEHAESEQQVSMNTIDTQVETSGDVNMTMGDDEVVTEEGAAPHEQAIAQAYEQSQVLEEQDPHDYEDGYMNVNEEDHIEQQEHQEHQDGVGTQYYDDFPSELGIMSNGEFLAVSQPVKKATRTKINVPSLPTSLQKQLVNTFTRSRISQEAMQVILEGSDAFFEQASSDLAAYAAHAGRRTIDESDVECLMQRLRITNDKVSIESLLHRYLPRELRDLVLFPSEMRRARRRH